MKRTWPVAFLVAFVLILSFHTLPSPNPVPHDRVRPQVEESAPPEHAESAMLPIAPPSAPSIETKAEEQPKPGTGSAVLAGLVWALQHQNDDGSWGDEPTTLGDRTIGKTGISSLVLLSLLGAGYSHLSRDEYEGIGVGPRVKKALEWLRAQQREDGSFRSGVDEPFDQALGASALSEAYGMTGSLYLKEPAALALDALVRFQGADGSWGGPD